MSKAVGLQGRQGPLERTVGGAGGGQGGEAGVGSQARLAKALKVIVGDLVG